MWIRGTATDEEVVVEYQPRVVFEGTWAVKYDADGEETGRVPRTRVRWDEPWIEIGRFTVARDEVAALCAPMQYGALVYGFMRHAVGLVVNGWGETAAEALTWFERPEAGDFLLVDGDYEVVGPCWPPFYPELLGATFTGVRRETVDATARWSVTLRISGMSYDLTPDPDQEAGTMLAALTAGTVPR